MALVEKTSSLSDHDRFFYNVLASKNCPIRNPRTLMWEFTLPEFLKLSEFVEIKDAFELAAHKDADLEREINK